jgi:uncharacterized protein
MPARCLLILVCLAALGPASAGVIEDHYGQWLGTLSIPQGPTLRVGLDLFARVDGSAGASLLSPDQNPVALPVDGLSAVDGRIHIVLSQQGIQLDLRPDGNELAGETRQGPMVAPLRLARVSSFGESLRPQTPRPPFPYDVEPLVVTTPDGTQLAGTFTHAHGVRKAVAVVLLPGSGPSDRDESFGGHHFFAVLADALTRRGISVYRFDKRGVSRSTGSHTAETDATLIMDSLAAVRAIRARPDVSRVGVIGHSEGAAVAAELAARYPRTVDFLTSLGGSGLPGKELILLQDRIGYERRGLTPAQVETLMIYGRSFYATIVAIDDVEARTQALQALAAKLNDDDRKLVMQYASNGTLSIGMARTPHLREILEGDHSQFWHAVHCPVLALNGALDVQVPPRENLDAIRAALQSTGNRGDQVESLPQLNHLLQTATTGLEDEYAKLDETVAPVALERIVRFVTDQH